MNDRVFTATLTTSAPLRVGSGDPGEATDLPLLRDADGGLYVPGTQIGGRLREAATRLAPALGWERCDALGDPKAEGAARLEPCGCRVCRLFGDRGQPPDEEGEEGARKRRERRLRKEYEPGASLLWCFDARAGDRFRRTVVRDGVGIARATGTSAAEAGALYDAEWIPANTVFSLRLELDARATPDDELVLALALSEWAAGRGRIGGGAARGGGAFTLDACEFRRADLSSRDGLLAFLIEDDPRQRGAPEDRWLETQVRHLAEQDARRGADASPLPAGAVGAFAELSFTLAFRGPVLVNDPAVALAHAVSAAPVFTGPDWESPVLPGSSVRGVLRAQAERIARTVAARGAGTAAGFARRCPACDPFRDFPSREADEPDASRDSGKPPAFPALLSCAGLARERRKGAGAPLTDEEFAWECLSCALFGSNERGSRLWIADAELATGAGAEYRLRDFVAIDRFTGGAKEGAKFDAVPLYSPAFRVTLLLWEPRGRELGMLVLALRDVHDGLATLGAHGSRGFGRAEVRDVSLRVGGIGGRGPALPEGVADAGHSGVFRVRAWQAPDAEALAQAAREVGWVGEFLAECKAERRKDPRVEQAEDAWFGATVDGLRLEDLYPLDVDLTALEAAHG